MARRVSYRTVINRKALSALHGAFVDAMAAVGTAVIAATRPPDATPFGKGLVTTGDWGVWDGTRKVAGTASKPRSVKLSKTGITLVAGYGFPGRFQEFGTIAQPPRPFLTPAMLNELPNTENRLRPAAQRALRISR